MRNVSMNRRNATGNTVTHITSVVLIVILKRADSNGSHPMRVTRLNIAGFAPTQGIELLPLVARG